MTRCPERVEGLIRRSTGTRFVLVGLGGFVVQAALLEGLTRLTTLDYRAATVLAVEAAVLHNFLWHDRWTWPRERASAGGWPRAMGQQALWHRAVRFHAATALVSVAGNVALMALLVGVFGWPVLPATAAAVVLLAIVNYRAADRWVFAETPGEPGQRDARDGRPSPASAQMPTPRRVPARVWHVVPALACCGLLVPAAPVLAGPPAEASAAWAQYVAQTERRVARELADGQRFLTSDFDPAQRETVRRRALGSEVVIIGDSVDVPSGLIHHWHGYTFISDVDLDTLLESVTDPTGPRAVQQEDVLEARVLSRTADGLRLFLKLQRSNIVIVAYNTEHDVRYRRHRDGRASSRSTATRVAELDDVGQPSERERSADRDRGFLWRMNSYWRYEAAPGGVIVELESLTLSRSLPWGMRAVARPVIEHVARESLERTLVSLGERTRRAAQQKAGPAMPAAPPPTRVTVPASKARTGAS